MKYLKYVFIFAFMFLVFSSDAAAMTLSEYIENYVPSEVVQVGEYPDLFVSTEPMFRMYSLTDNRYGKEEEMQVSSLIYRLYKNGSMIAHSSFTFGENQITNRDLKLEMHIQNNGNPLFTQTGTMGIDVEVRGRSASLIAIHANGTEEVFHINCGTTTVTTHYITIDNPLADIVELVLHVNPWSDTAASGEFVTGGFYNYGYELKEFAEEPEEPEPEVPLVGSDLSGTIGYILSFIVSVVDALFLLQIVEGVTFGYFIIACMIFGIVFSFLFRNMVK